MQTPNPNNKRTRARLKNALGMTLACLSPDEPRPLGTRFIDRYYSQQQNEVSRWLRQTLLTEHKSSFKFGSGKSECKTYTYNPRGVALIKQLLDDETVYNSNSNLSYEQQVKQHSRRMAVEWVDTVFDIDDIEYADKSNRLWHPIQNLPKETRKDYFYRVDMPAQYDIVACAPNLLHQRSWRHSYGLVLESIDDYTQNRSAIRKKLADEAELPVNNIKQLINSFFAGASLGANPKFECWNLCGGDVAKIKFLQQHPFIIDLKSDIKEMWNYLKPELNTTTITDRKGRTRKLVLTPSNKWNLYFQLERSVLNSIRNYLDQFDIKHFLLHDAFASPVLSDEMITDLIEFVRIETGFFIELERD